MGKYSKAIGSLVGAVAGLLVAYGLVPEDVLTDEVQAAVVVLITVVATYIAPANRPV